MVVAFHAREVTRCPWLAPSGYLAVDVFFVISGFVIAHAYASRVPVIGWAGFMRLRLIRLAPLFWLGGLLGLARLAALAFTHHRPDVGPLGVVAYFLLLPAPPGSADGDALSPLNGPGWSLLLELAINLVWAVALPWLNRRLLIATVVSCGLALALSAVGGVDFAISAHWSGLWLGLLRVGYAFGLGLLLYQERGLLPTGRRTVPLALIGMVALAMVPPGAMVQAAALVGAPLLVVLALGAGMNGPDRIARYGAASSYGLYALHWPVIVIAGALATRVAWPLAVIPVVAIALLLAIMPALDRWLDRPCRRALARAISRVAGPLRF